MSLVFTLSCLD